MAQALAAVNGQAAERPNFNGNTRQKWIKLQPITRPVGGGLYRQTLPKVGYLARLWLRLQVAVAGTLSAPNALGISSAINRIRIETNAGVDLFSITGAGFAYLLNEALESEYFLGFGQNAGKTAVTATNFNVDVLIPISINLRDPIGLLMLQSEQLQATLVIDWTADATVATGATVTVTTGEAYMEIFTVPQNPIHRPDISVVHQILEDATVVAAAGDITYNYLRGQIYIGMYHGMGIAASGSDNFTNVKLRVNQADYLVDATPNLFDMWHRLYRGRARVAGQVLFDLMASSGLGMYGLTRDIFNTQLVTDWAAIFTAAAAGTLYTQRRQLVRL